MWSKSQEALIKLAGQKVEGGELDIVQVHEFQSGVTKTLKYIEAHSRMDKRMPRSIVLNGVRGWDTCLSITKKAELEGWHKTGCLGYLDRIHTGLKVFSEEGKRAVVLWLEESRMMRPTERELIAAHVDYISHYLKIPVRCVFIVGKVMLWDNRHQQRVPGFPPFSNRLRCRATVYEFHKRGMEESEQVPESTRETERRAIHIA